MMKNRSTIEGTGKVKLFYLQYVHCGRSLEGEMCFTTGIKVGRSGGQFAPKETAARAESAAMIQRFVETVLN